MIDLRSSKKTIKNLLSKYDVVHQIIFATKSIADELDSTDYIVGEKFTEDNKSLLS